MVLNYFSVACTTSTFYFFALRQCPHTGSHQEISWTYLRILAWSPRSVFFLFSFVTPLNILSSTASRSQQPRLQLFTISLASYSLLVNSRTSCVIQGWSSLYFSPPEICLSACIPQHCHSSKEKKDQTSHKSQGLCYRDIQELFSFYALSKILLIWINWMREWPQNNLGIAAERADAELQWCPAVKNADSQMWSPGTAILTNVGLETRSARHLSMCEG